MILDIIYAVILILVKVGLKFRFNVTIKGVENIPKKGPVILLSNHTTIVDSFLLGCNVPRKIYYMAKSTEFESLAKRIFFYLSRSFPVRRYDIDPGALRNAYKIIEYGGMVGIYPEGERTWDGKLQPLRRGTIRFVLSAGVPVITAGIKGAYQHQPRWGGIVGNPPIVLSFGKPIKVKKIRGKDQKKKDIDALNDKIVKSILELSK